MSKGKILFICGSLNQTTMMHEISKHLDDFDCVFTPYYADGFVEVLRKMNLLDFTILGGIFKDQTVAYLENNELQIDYKGLARDYDLVFTCADLIIPKNIRNNKIILVQEGMTDPENFTYYLVKSFHLPRYLASTATQGLSDRYTKFCVASEGYKKFFIRKGVKESKLVVTGIPNFDNLKIFSINKFPLKHFILAATSDARETFKYENRKKFIRTVLNIANGRAVVFKLHPNENYKRAAKEIKRYAPNALVLTNGNINEMIANCDVLITKYSTVVYVGMTLEKEVYSDFDLSELRKIIPIQNNGTSALNIAQVGREVLSSCVYDSPMEKHELKLQEV